MIPVSTVVLTKLLKPLRALAVWRDGCSNHVSDRRRITAYVGLA